MESGNKVIIRDTALPEDRNRESQTAGAMTEGFPGLLLPSDFKFACVDASRRHCSMWSAGPPPSFSRTVCHHIPTHAPTSGFSPLVRLGTPHTNRWTRQPPSQYSAPRPHVQALVNHLNRGRQPASLTRPPTPAHAHNPPYMSFIPLRTPWRTSSLMGRSF